MSVKSENALRTIGEVAKELGVEQHVLRFWDTKFKQIKPQKRRGRRYYRPQDVKLVSIIKSLLYTQGFTIKGAERFLKNNAERIGDNSILELTQSMAIKSLGSKSDDSNTQSQLIEQKEQNTMPKHGDENAQSNIIASKKPRVNLRVASPASQLQPSLFALPSERGADASRQWQGTKEGTSVAAVESSDASAVTTKQVRMSEGDKRRLREVYRGLCYTKEKLDEATA